MKNTTRLSTILTAALCALVSFQANNQLSAATVTFFGDFEDGFGPGPAYDSSDPPAPGSFDLVFSEVVVGIPKFDPSLGALTDITVFVPGTLFYTVDGGIAATEGDPGVPGGFSASVDIAGDVGVNYEEPGGLVLHSVITDFVDLSGGCGGMPGDGGCGDALFSIGDGVLDGSDSIFAIADPADFVGPGFVDSLFVQLFLESTATFSLFNSMATADIFFDVFDGDSGADDAVIGVTYTYTPIPEPASLLLVVSALALIGGKRRRT